MLRDGLQLPNLTEAWHNVAMKDAAKDCAQAAAALTTLIAERDAATALNNKYAWERDKAREERDAAERRSEAHWKPRLETAEAQLKAAREMHSWPQEALFQYGDWVEKYTGEALWEGRVVSAYYTKRLALRYVVEVEPQGFQMIAVPAQLRTALSLDTNKGDVKP